MIPASRLASDKGSAQWAGISLPLLPGSALLTQSVNLVSCSWACRGVPKLSLCLPGWPGPWPWTVRWWGWAPRVRTASWLGCPSLTSLGSVFMTSMSSPRRRWQTTGQLSAASGLRISTQVPGLSPERENSLSSHRSFIGWAWNNLRPNKGKQNAEIWVKLNAKKNCGKMCFSTVSTNTFEEINWWNMV